MHTNICHNTTDTFSRYVEDVVQLNATQELIPVKLVNTQPWLLCSTVLLLRPRELSGKLQVATLYSTFF